MQQAHDEGLSSQAPVVMHSVAKSFTHRGEAVPVLSELSFEVGDGEIVALMGPSGSGKSTVLNICAGLETADEGEVRILGADLGTASEAERSRLRLEQIGVVFQDDNLLEELSAVENVMLPLLARRLPKEQALEEARYALELMDVAELEHRRPSEISGGQAQRVGIARAVAGGKRLLLADEPTGALDEQTSHIVFEAMGRLSHQGVSVLVVTHDPLIRNYADRTLEIRKLNARQNITS